MNSLPGSGNRMLTGDQPDDIEMMTDAEERMTDSELEAFERECDLEDRYDVLREQAERRAADIGDVLEDMFSPWEQQNQNWQHQEDEDGNQI